MRFVGYDQCSKGLRFTDENRKIIVSREAHFVDRKFVRENFENSLLNVASDPLVDQEDFEEFYEDDNNV
jgi:hypothetical protein